MTEPGPWDLLSVEVEKRWSEGRRATLLSQVPGILKKIGSNVDTLRGGKKLSEVLAEGAGPKLKLITNDEDPKILGLVPAGATLSVPNATHFGIKKALGDSGNEPRFSSAVWKAFASSVAPGQRRYLFVEGRPRFADADHALDTGLEVEPEYQVDDTLEGPARAKQVVGNIEKWALSHGVPKHRLLATSHKSDVQPALVASSLGTLLRLLTPAEMKRVKLPLDVVDRLSKLPAEREK